MFLKIDGIAGESQDATHLDEIDVINWGWAVTQKSNMHSGSGGGAAKASVEDLSFSHEIDRASPNLAGYAFRGQHISKAMLTMRKAGGTPLEYFRAILYDVVITHVEQAAGNGMALEHVRLSFARMTQEYLVQNATGGSQGAVTTSIDVKQNSVM